MTKVWNDDEGAPLKRGYLLAEDQRTGHVSAYKVRDGKILSDFTRVVEETGVLQKEAPLTKRESDHE